jgi:hypothetical protein
MSKTIHINPDLFKVSGGNTTRKKTPFDPEKKIRVKQPKENKTTKRALLQFIRAKQNDYMKTQGKPKDSTVGPTPETEKFNSDFDESMKYLKHLSEQPPNRETAKHNHTIRNYSAIHNPISIGQPTSLPTSLPTHLPMNLPTPPFTKPQYGCLKGGSLPTYRNWKNVTQKKMNPPEQIVPTNTYVSAPPVLETQTPYDIQLGGFDDFDHEPAIESASTHVPPAISDIRENQMLQNRQLISEMKQSKEYNDTIDKIRSNKVRYPKQKRVSRRTYLLGKSKTYPKVSVLVSNRTIRNKITTQKQLIKQTPLPEIKKYLIKHGFIKIGTTAPNDVLRKMYETATLMCGQIHNHNPDNLLYNFFYNSKEKV